MPSSRAGDGKACKVSRPRNGILDGSFPRSQNSLIQTIGRAARHARGEATLYADRITGSIERALAETNRRRAKQIVYNLEHGIASPSTVKTITDVTEEAARIRYQIERLRHQAFGPPVALAALKCPNCQPPQGMTAMRGAGCPGHETPGQDMGAVKSLLQVALLLLLFGTALAVRLYGITGPPLDFHPTKQYRSALTTRAYYFEQQPTVPEWQREVARDNLRRIGVIVPTLQERAIARVYQLMGGEYLWLGRALSVAGWLIGGLFLFALARRMASFEGALLGTAFYLLLPFSVVASQSFQPDPLMVMAMVAALFMSVRYHEEGGAMRFGLAVAAGAVAVLIKPISIFLVAAGFVGASLGFGEGTVRRRVVEWLALAALAALPSALYYLYRVALQGVGDWDGEVNFLPSYVLQLEFWDNWLKRLRISLGITFVVAGLVGALLARSKATRCLLLALWAGYLAMCFSITYKVSTHDYYHLPLIPIVALGLAQLVDSQVEVLGRLPVPAWRRIALWSVVLVALFIAAGTSVQARRRVPDFAPDIATAKTVGELVGHSTLTVILAQHYGRPLMYHGQISGQPWPDRWDIRDEHLLRPSPRSAAERLAGMLDRNPADFFVVLDREEFAQQPELARLLRDNFPVHAEADDFVIYDLRDARTAASRDGRAWGEREGPGGV